ncbi:MAG: DUF6807 family protein [Pirellulales bacterium]
MKIQTLVRTAVFFCLVAIGARAMAAEPIEVVFEIDAGKHERVNGPVCVPITLNIKPGEVKAAMVRDAAGRLPAQVTALGLRSNGGGANAELHFIVPRLDAGEKRRFRARILTDEDPVAHLPRFQWRDEPGKQTELTLRSSSYAVQSDGRRERPVLRYMYEKLDTSSAARRDETIKPFHHVFDPEGDALITKGPGGKYTHHRGLFFGFNKVIYDGNKPADVWHCRNGESQQHVEFLAQEAGPVLGRHRMKIEWRGRQDDVFAIEERELTAYNTPRGTLIEFASRVETTGGEVKLDGDPQHAGFHFRASNEVSEKTAKQTHYQRPDGQGKPGETRNWPGHKRHVDLPWNAMSFVVGGQRFTALYLDQPTNPKQARFSERDYGRFGSYFEYTVTKDKPLEVSYRVWVQRGELSGEEAQLRDNNFDEPVQITVQ